MNKEKIKIIFFDVDDVLLEHDYSFDDELCRLLVTDIDNLNKIRNNLYEDANITQQWLDIDTLHKENLFYKRFYTIILEKLGKKYSPETIEEIIKLRISKKQSRKLIPGIKDLLNLLIKKYRLGIITNATPSRKEIELKCLNLDKYFNPIIVSCEFHCMKPDIRIYQIALEKAGFLPEEATFIDNKLENVLGSLKAGYQTGICICEDIPRSRDNIIYIKSVLEVKNLL